MYSDSPGGVRPGRRRVHVRPIGAIYMENSFEPIVTDRLTLRCLEIRDSETVFGYRSKPEVSRYQNWEPESPGEIGSFIENLSEIGPDTPGKWFQLGIVLSESGELIGDCGIHVSAQDPSQVEVGITLSPRFHRRGLASEALTAVLGFLFTRLDKHRVYGSVDPGNTASLALLRRVGMRKEAHFVESLRFKGAWADDVIYAMLKREWLEIKGT